MEKLTKQQLKTKATIGMVNQLVNDNPEVKKALRENGNGIIKDNYDMKELAKTIQALPDPVFNAYYNSMINKIGTQIITASYDNSGFKGALDIFKIVSPATGDTMELADFGLIKGEGINYGTDTKNGENNPFGASKAINYVKHLKIKPTINYSIENQKDVIAEAFTSTQSLEGYISRLVKVLQDSADSETWNSVRGDFLNGIVKEVKTGVAYDFTKAEDIKNLYKFITKTAMDMEQESEDYNEGVQIGNKGPLVPKLNATPISKQILVLNSTAISNFNVDVIASLFNSNKLIGETFRVLRMPFLNADKTPLADKTKVAVLMDEGRYILAMKMNEMSAIYNPKGPSQITHLNRKLWFGHIDYFNGVWITNKV